MITREKIDQFILFRLILWLLILAAHSAPADEFGIDTELLLNCQERTGYSFGPFDYTNPIDVKNNLDVVESHHFAPVVEQLISDQNGRPDPWHDIEYVLRAFPNHHRALYAMSRYLRQSDFSSAQGARNSADCWFYEAMKIAPRDAVVYSIYGLHLHKTDRLDEALERYKQSLHLSPESADTHYNIGLLYFDLREYEASRQHAREAYKLGYPLPGLRSKLQRVGQWPTEDN